MARFYAMCLQPTLFGDWALLREWGRIGSTGRMGPVASAPNGRPLLRWKSNVRRSSAKAIGLFDARVLHLSKLAGIGEQTLRCPLVGNFRGYRGRLEATIFPRCRRLRQSDPPL